jgi:hypothetical protein
MPETVQAGTADRLQSVDETLSTSQGIQTAAHLILVDKLNYSEEEARVEVERLKERQKLVDFVNRFSREVNNNTKDADGTLNTEPFQALKDEGYALLELAQQKRARAEELKNQQLDLDPSSREFTKLQKEIEWLEDSAKEIEETLKSCDIINSQGERVVKHRYTESERERMVENLRSHNKNLSQTTSYQQQVIQKLNNARHETLMIAKQIIDTLHSAIRRIWSNLGGR